MSVNPSTALLGAALSGFGDVDQLAAIIDPADFPDARDEAVWRGVLSVREAGNRPDPISVRVAMGSDAASLPNGPAYLVDLAQTCPHVGSAPLYARQLADDAASRRLANAAAQLREIATHGMDASDLAEEARAILDKAITAGHHTGGRTFGEILPDVLDQAQHGTAATLPTPWGDLDTLIGGIAPGRLIVVGARPGVGKSLFGTNLALHVAHAHQHPVILCSLEMSDREVGQRLLACHARVNLTSIITGRSEVTEAMWDRMARCQAEIDAMPLTVHDDGGLTLTDVRQHVRRAKSFRPDVALVIVDYLQLMRTPGSRPRYVEIGDISRGLKALAREFEVCVVAMAQVNRTSTHREGGRPTMADLRESGDIEADADQVILLHQPDLEAPDVEVIVDKNRHGSPGIRTLSKVGQYARLDSVHWTPTRGIA